MDPSRFWGSIRRLLNQAVVCSAYPFLWKFQQIGSSDQPDRRSNVDHVWFSTILKPTQMLSDLSHLLPLLLLDQVALDCAQKQESAFTELGLAPKHDRFIACFSPLQAKARRAAEEVKATSLPHPWIGSEQGSTNSHEDRRFRHFLDHSHPSLDDEILACHTAVTAGESGESNQHRPTYDCPGSS